MTYTAINIPYCLTGRRDQQRSKERVACQAYRFSCVSRHRDAVAIVNAIADGDWFGGGDSQRLSAGDDRAGDIGTGYVSFCLPASANAFRPAVPDAR